MSNETPQAPAAVSQQNTAPPAQPVTDKKEAQAEGSEELNPDGTPLSDKQRRKRAEKA